MRQAERPRTPVKDRALRLLTARSRSSEEIRRRLLRAGYEDAEVAAAIEDLESVGLVDDERFAREVVAHQVGRKLAGRRAAVGALRRAGIPTEDAERAVDEGATGDEEARAEELARTRLGRLSSLEPGVAFRRLVGFLRRRGYDAGTAYTVARRVIER
ncbi:MAG: regulatory protein RecX [Actinomycetota bacterium]